MISLMFGCVLLLVWKARFTFSENSSQLHFFLLMIRMGLLVISLFLRVITNSMSTLSDSEKSGTFCLKTRLTAGNTKGI